MPREFLFVWTGRSTRMTHDESGAKITVRVLIGRETWSTELEFSSPLAARDFIGRAAADTMLRAVTQREREAALEAYRKYDDSWKKSAIVGGRLVDQKA